MDIILFEVWDGIEFSNFSKGLIAYTSVVSEPFHWTFSIELKYNFK